jgi:hypothetical protein
MGARGSRAITLDAGALIAFERGDPRVRSAIQLGLETEADIAVPAGALAQAWRDGRRQASLSRLVGDRRVRIEDLTATIARAAGVLCGRAGTADVVDASVVLCALAQGDSVILTGDPDDIRRLAAGVEIRQV